MMPRWRKVIRDIFTYRGRSLIVLIAIMIGTTAVTAALGSTTVINREMQLSFHDTEPVQATIWLSEDVTPELLEEIRQQPNVEFADARRLVRGRIANNEGEWHSVLIYGVDQFEKLEVSAFHNHEGVISPDVGTMLVEQSALPVLQATVGDALDIRTISGEASITISGIVHDPALAPAWMEDVGYVYVSRETLDMLGVGATLDEIRITVGDEVTREQISEVTQSLTTWLSVQGFTIERAELPPPGQEHPHYDQMGAVFALLALFSIMALILSGALTASIMTALIAKQVRQVGIMKATGATSWQVAGIYVRYVLILAVIGVLIGIPLGIQIAQPFVTYATTELNLEVTSLAISNSVLALAALAGLLIPIVVAGYPILRATRITANEAIQDTGIQTPPKRSERASSGRFDRTLTFALRNTFRRPGRLAMTLLALAFGGAVLMTAVNVYQSLTIGMTRATTYRSDDIDVRLLQPAPEGDLINVAESVSGVATVEAWGSVLASISLDEEEMGNTTSTERYALSAPPVDTVMVNFPVYRGRWLENGDTSSVVINRALQDRERALGLDVGSQVNLVAFANTITVDIVGVIEEAGPPGFYITPTGMTQLTGLDDQFTGLRVIANADNHEQVAHSLEEALVGAGYFPFFVMTRDEAHEALLDHFIILLVILVTASVSVIIVGGLALTTNMTLSVIERQREIGIVRAIGATRSIIMRMLLIEGSAVALLSIVLAILLSIPLSTLGAFLVGNHGLHMRLPIILSLWAMLGWFILASVVTFIACLGPAQNMMRLSVRDVLSHE